MTLFVLPPAHFGYRCQAAISMKARKPTQQYVLQPLPKWRYCSWCGDTEDGVTLCWKHRPIANTQGMTRLLPELKMWEPPERKGIDSKRAEW